MSTESTTIAAPAPGQKSLTAPPSYQGPQGVPTTINCRSSDNLAYLLANANISFLVSTYLIGNVITVGSRGGQLVIEFHTFDRPMGMAISKEGLTICTRSQVWFMPAMPDIGAQMEPKGQYDSAFFARKSHFTGNISVHEAAWVGKELWICNTRFSCLCTLHPTCHFAPRWRPPFITNLAPEDRCHLNGLATANGQARYVTTLAETNTREGWRPVKATAGCVIDVLTNQVIARGFAMPHSPRVINDKLYVLNSGMGRLECIDPANGKSEVVCELPGYTRGFSSHGSYAFIGLSKIRPSSSMDGVPIAARASELKCGVWVVDLNKGAIVSFLEFTEGFDELFGVLVIPGFTSPFISGPLTDHYAEKTNWTLPPH